MSDFECRLREAMSAAVADAQPPRAVMELVRRRHRRRNARAAAASAVALAVVVAAVPIASALNGGGRPAHERTSSVPLFPGGGRILFRTHGDLKWLYPDGRTVQIASGFAGATPQGTRLLAWKQTRNGFSYYTMNLDGSNPRLVLPAERDKQFNDLAAQLSPDGARLAYIRQDVLPSGKVTAQLWSVDLATLRKTDIGPVFRSAFVWRDNATILAESVDGRALQLVNVSDGSRTTYLTVTDLRLIRAYERARPGAGPPASISPDGWGTGASSSALAVSLATRNSSGYFSKPAEVLVEKGRDLAFAPDSRQQLTLTWGPGGEFILETFTGDNPADANLYAGIAGSPHLYRVESAGIPNLFFNPAGTVIAEDTTWFFVPVPAAICRQQADCTSIQSVALPLPDPGTLLAWARR